MTFLKTEFINRQTVGISFLKIAVNSKNMEMSVIAHIITSKSFD